MIIISAQFITTFLLCMYLVNVTLHPFFSWTQCCQTKVVRFGFFSFNLWKEAKLHTQPSGFRTVGDSCILCFSHRNNKWTYSVRMGEWINQQRCCFVWNATINHRGLMSGRRKGQWCKELWREDAPFVVIYYCESIGVDLGFTQSEKGLFKHSQVEIIVFFFVWRHLLYTLVH